MNEFLIAFLGKTLNIAPEQVADILYKKADDGKHTDQLNESALQSLLAADAARVQKLKGDTDTKTVFDNGYKKGQSEALTKMEKSLREKAGVESDKTGEDLVLEVLSKVGKSQLSEDQIKLHPLYLSLESKAKAELETIKAESDKRVQEVQTGYQREKTLSAVKSKARDIFTALSPILSANPTVAANQIDEFLQKFESFGYENNGDDWVVKNGDKRLEDAHSNPISFASLVKMEAEKRFDFQKQPPAGNAGNKNEPGQNGNFAVPKNADEYARAIFAANTPEERLTIQTAWEKSQSG